MAKIDVAAFVCRPFCSFYREGEKEDLICNGARLMEILLKIKALDADSLAGVAVGASLSPGEYSMLEKIVCSPCPFLEDGCDFRSKPPPLNAEPCGGFIILALLAGKGLLSIERLSEIPVE
jgi:hypothetical protein